MSVVIFLCLLIALWQIFYWIGVDVLALFKSYAVPSPLGVGERFIELSSNGTLWEAVGNSLLRGVAGYAIAIVIGVVLGLLINHFPYLQKNLKPFVLGIQTLPSVCWVPFSILWFGLSTQAILFVVLMGSAFGIAISVDNAIKNVQPIYIKAALTMGAGKRQMYWNVILPASLPELVSGLKQGWSFAWRALMAGEVMTTSVGLGQTLIMGRDLADINQVMLVMVVIIVVGILIDKLIFSVIEKRLLTKRGLWEKQG
ncbi:MAG: ABC transporter permease [Lachnospiraceae bacterium]|nr:ABC transporter permease [Lachnospiraceae bacterium]